MMFTEELELAFGLIEQFPHAGEEFRTGESRRFAEFCLPARYITSITPCMSKTGSSKCSHFGTRVEVVLRGFEASVFVRRDPRSITFW